MCCVGSRTDIRGSIIVFMSIIPLGIAPTKMAGKDSEDIFCSESTYLPSITHGQWFFIMALSYSAMHQSKVQRAHCRTYVGWSLLIACLYNVEMWHIPR